MSEKKEPIDELEHLSQMLDELNAGMHPECSDKETAELLEIANFIQKESPSLPPPQHILDQTVDRALAGIEAGRKKKTRVWWYSGTISSAAAVILVIGLNLLPSWQQQEGVPPLQSSAIEAPNSTAPQEQTIQSLASATSKQTAQLPVKSKPSQTVPNSEKKKLKPPDDPFSLGNTRMRSDMTYQENTFFSTESLAKMAPPAISPLKLPGQTPDVVVTNQRTGTLRQVYFKGTSKELTIIQYHSPSNPGSSQANHPSSHSNGDINTVQVTIADQDVTLVGRQSSQELLKIASSLTP